jgi:GTP pyrophosphokinase
MITIDEILTELASYNANADLAIVKKAFEFAAKAHAGQKRKSGEPYLIHLLEVAKILTKMRMDTASVVAAILHDTIEDTDVTKDDVAREFGAEISEIIDGVTKLSKLQFSNKEVRQAETYRKMILAMSKDIRVILVKLADRLHNMRTLQYMSEEKQISISQETLDIYAPIAGRMGIQWIKEELENLSLKFNRPEIFKQIEARIAGLAKNREEYMHKVRDLLEKQIRPYVPDVRIKGRVKKPYSVYMKMQRQQITLDEVHDLIAFRVLVPSIENCYEVLGNIHALWRPVQGRFKDYVAMPKDNNYQSLHTTVICLDGERVEFQIRTVEMDETAEKGIAAHWKYKEDGRIDTKDEAKFHWLRQLVDWHRDLKDALEFVDTVKLDLFSDEIYVFTPRGDVRRFSHGATPVDFAYAVHSDVGHHCSGAKINGRIVPLNHRLESGDTIEILTNKSHVPNKDWLDFVATSKAKSHIRSFIRNEQRSKSVMIGRNLFEDECGRKGLSHTKVVKTDEFLNFLKDKNLPGIEEFYSALAYGKVGTNEILDSLLNKDVVKEAAQENVIKKIFQKVGVKNKNLILVDQQDDILVTFAKCCSPVNGDPIVGFVTRGRGVTVHRASCNKVFSTDTERRVDVAWNDKADLERVAKVVVFVEDRKGMLADITKVISEKGVNITKLLVKTTKDSTATILLDVSVKHASELLRVIKAIENIRGVLKAERE